MNMTSAPPPKRSSEPWPGRPPCLWLCAALICCAALVMVVLYRYRGGSGYPLDDTWIHLAFARNLAAGQGFSINPGEPTPGATSPLWVVILSIGFLCGADAEPWPWAIDTCLLAACGLLAAGLCRALQPQKRGSWHVLVGSCFCGLATVMLAPLVWSAAGAMEVPLISTLLLAAIWMFLWAGADDWRHAFGWGICAGLAANARPEALLLIPILAALELLRAPRQRLLRAAAGSATAVLLTLPYAIFCLRTSGRWFANTFYAKTYGTSPHLPDLPYLWDLAQLVWHLSPAVIVLLPFGLLAILLWRKDGRAAAPAAGLAYVLALPLAYACMQRSTVLFADLAGNFGRYLYPILPVALAVGWAGLLRVADWRAGRPPAAAVTLATVLVLVTGWQALARAETYAHNVRDINRMQVRMAESLNKALPPGALVAANDVGALAYLTDLRVLDLIGIISVDVLDLLRPPEGKPPKTRFLLAKHLAHRQPAALVLFPRWYPKIYRWLEPGLEIIEDVQAPDDITSGAGRLTAFRIDWSRVPDPTKAGSAPGGP